MSDFITIARDELSNLEERVKKLAMEKAYLQLLTHLMNRLSAAPGLENTLESTLRIVLDNIGGTNLMIYYVIDNEIHYVDVSGRKMKLGSVDDVLVKEVFETRRFIEHEHDFSDTRMMTPEFTKATTWVFPLLVGPDLIGVFKMEGMHIGARELRSQLDLFFNYAALILKNEILGHTRLQKAFDQLSKANTELTNEVAERRRAEEKIQASLREKETLLREIHHRVKNNLQVISSLLSLQSQYIEDKRLLEIFRESENRVRTMALVHKMLYQSEDLSAVGFDSFISNLVGIILQSYRTDSSDIKVNLDVHDIQLDIAAAIPFGLILNELISNALKHAFPGEAKGEISLIMRVEGDRIVTRFQDSGIGFPETLDFRNTQSLGLQLVNILVGQLRGTIELAVDGGTTFNITFSIPDK